MAAVNSASGAPAAKEKHRTSSTMRSSQTLTLPHLLSCHCLYAALRFATLSDDDAMAVTSRIDRGQSGPEPRKRRDPTTRGRDPITRPRLALDAARANSRPETWWGPLESSTTDMRARVEAAT